MIHHVDGTLIERDAERVVVEVVVWCIAQNVNPTRRIQLLHIRLEGNILVAIAE